MTVKINPFKSFLKLLLTLSFLSYVMNTNSYWHKSHFGDRAGSEQPHHTLVDYWLVFQASVHIKRIKLREDGWKRFPVIFSLPFWHPLRETDTVRLAQFLLTDLVSVSRMLRFPNWLCLLDQVLTSGFGKGRISWLTALSGVGWTSYVQRRSGSVAKRGE